MVAQSPSRDRKYLGKVAIDPESVSFEHRGHGTKKERPAKMAFGRAAKTNEITPGRFGSSCGGQAIAPGHVACTFYAINNTCPLARVGGVGDAFTG